MYNIDIHMTDMLTIDTLVLLIAISCLIIGYMLVRFKFYPIVYFIKGTIVKDKVLSNIESVHLKNVKQKYGLILSMAPILGFSWGLFGIVLTCLIAFNKFTTHYFSSKDISYLLTVINFWVIANIVFLSIIPLLFLFTKASIPLGLKRSFNKRFLIFTIIIEVFGLLYSHFVYEIPLVGLFILFLLSVPCVFSSWFIGEYFAVYVIRSFFQSSGWDFVMNEKVSIFGRLKGLISFISSIITPIIAINSLVAVLNHNTNKGGFIGIWLLSLPNIPIHWTFTILNPFTFTVLNPWKFKLTEPSFNALTNIIIIFLIVGPLVTFIFRPTYIFELTLNSKIYQTLINFNWDNFKQQISGDNDSVIIHSLTTKEMIGLLIFFVSFINYIAVLSVGAVIGSFGINFDSTIGLGLLNGTIKLIEIPVLFFVEFLIMHDLSEERELIHLALKGKRMTRKHIEEPSFLKKPIVPKEPSADFSD